MNTIDAFLGGGASAVGPGDQFVGFAGHGRHHDGDLMSGRDFSRHQTTDASDTLEVGDGRAAEFHH